MARIPLYYTFGNHMHWVDMEWLWGYHVLPGSIRDMLHFCRETGARGNVNFEGIGYEKLAGEDPESLAELRDAVREGIIEPVGCSYGQPYGLFHGGESNLRQRIYGARTVRRLLGVWPRTFWEEEFDFFPQLPQMLKGCGFEYASLFFQWTWHTPEIPKEEAPVVLWEGQDGSRLVCATRNKLNLHQWPEDMDATFAELASSPPKPNAKCPTHLILQWLELMPSPDWMCRSEVLLPKMRELLADDRFEIRMATLGEYLSEVRSMGSPGSQETELHDRDDHATYLPVRNYSMDRVWHGMSLGKNADYIRRESRAAEEMLTTHEALFSALSLLGRPYAQWDVYPTWELEEGWRKLLSAQHHDNDECEGLCAHVAYADYEWLRSLLCSFGDHVGRHGSRWPERSGFFNPNGWEAFGLPPYSFGDRPGEVDWPTWTVENGQATATFNDLRVEIDLEAGEICAFTSGDFPDGVFSRPVSLLPVPNEKVRVKSKSWEATKHTILLRCLANGQSYICAVSIDPDRSGLKLATSYHHAKPLFGGYQGALKLELPFRSLSETLRTDAPYGVVSVKGEGQGHKKYPAGDWMTSPQWFEEVSGAFSALGFAAFDDPTRGAVVLQKSPKQWFRKGDAVQCVLGSYDPWDEGNFRDELNCVLTIVPYAKKTNADCWKLAHEKPPVYLQRTPPYFSAISSDSPNVIPTALYRETEDYSGKHVENYAGKGMGYPFVIRLVEFDGLETEATLNVAGSVAKAYKTNHVGQIQEELRSVKTASSQSQSSTCETEEVGPRSQVFISLRPYEIATVYLDIVEGRKQTRDLDAKREIWATVHRVDGSA